MPLEIHVRAGALGTVRGRVPGKGISTRSADSSHSHFKGRIRDHGRRLRPIPVDPVGNATGASGTVTTVSTGTAGSPVTTGRGLGETAVGTA